MESMPATPATPAFGQQINAVALGPELSGFAQCSGPGVLPASEKRVVVDVSGSLYLTTLGVLRRAPFFARNLPATFPGDVLKDVFVDRDPRHFRTVLNVLRGYEATPERPDGAFVALHTTPDSTHADELLAEFKFFGMDEAARGVFAFLYAQHDQTANIDALWENAKQAEACERIQQRDQAIFAGVLSAYDATRKPHDMWSITLDMERARAIYATARGGDAGWTVPAADTEMQIGSVWMRVRTTAPMLDDAHYVAALHAWMAGMFTARPPLDALLAHLAATVPRARDDSAPPGRRVALRIGTRLFTTTERTLRSAEAGSRIAALPDAPVYEVDGFVIGHL